MTGHHAHQRSIHARNVPPASDHRLDQFAAGIAEARAGNPAVAALADEEQAIIDQIMDLGAHLDRQTVGATLVILGQILGQRVQSTPPEQQAQVLGMLYQASRLAGQRLYDGDRLPVEMPCPFPYATGAPCKTVIKAPTQEHADTLMGAHAWQQHPGETWPPEIAIAGDGCAELVSGDLCACGSPAVWIRGTFNRPDGSAGVTEALCRDCAGGEARG